MSDYPVLSTTPGRRDTALAPASLGTAGQRQRVNAGATAPEWSDPDLVCTAAELATTYAPSAVLRGVVAYTSDTLATYVCRRTAASTYSWAQVGGGVGGAAYTVSTKTTTYTAVAGDVLLCDASGGAFTVTLPAAATVSGASISVKKTDASANAVTIDGNAAETIDGAATLALSTQYEAVTLWSDGTSWWVSESHKTPLPASSVTGLPSHTSGTLAARPASPAAGDTYAVTSGVATGDRYACLVAGAWTLVDYSRVRLDETPYHWWRLGDFSGGAVDSGSGSADLAAVGSGGWAYASSTPLGAGAEVSGSTGSRYLRSAVGAGVALTTKATIAAWVRATDVSATRAIFALETNQGTNSQPYATIALSITGGALRGWLTTTAQSGSGQSTTGGTIAAYARHLVGATWDSGTLKLWVDGVSVATLAATGTTLYTAGSSERWTAGDLVGPGERWAGSLADLRVYTDAKDSAWWLETYARGAGSYEGQ